MAAVARIDYRLEEDEFWRLTPRQFDLYGKRHAECEKRKLRRVQFLATVTAQAAGNPDVNYLDDEDESEAEDGERRSDPALFEAWLKARSNGSQNPDGGPQAAAKGHEEHGDVA